MEMNQAEKNSNNVFSYSKLEELVNGDKDAIEHFTMLFVTETIGNDLEKMIEFVKNSDYEGLRQIAHKMKSPIGLYSIQSVHNALRQIEKMAREKTAIRVISPLVEDTVETLTEIKRKILSRQKQ